MFGKVHVRRLVLLLLARLGASRADDRWLGGPPIINLHPPKTGGSTLCVAAQAMGLTPILNCRLPADSALYDNALGPFPLPDPDGPNGPLNCSARVALADRVRVRYTDNERYLQAEDAPRAAPVRSRAAIPHGAAGPSRARARSSTTFTHGSSASSAPSAAASSTSSSTLSPLCVARPTFVASRRAGSRARRAVRRRRQPLRPLLQRPRGRGARTRRGRRGARDARARAARGGRRRPRDGASRRRVRSPRSRLRMAPWAGRHARAPRGHAPLRRQDRTEREA